MILISINLFAWEVNTHRAIDKEALKKVDNLEAFKSATGIDSENYINEEFEDYGKTYIDYVLNGEENGISNDALNQTFNQANANYKSLLEAGSILEDAQWPHWKWPNYIPNPIINAAYNKFDQAHGRFTNHFYT